MERPKQPVVFKRHRNRGLGERKSKPANRETKQNFWRRAAGSGSTKHSDTKQSLQKRKQVRRAKNKRARVSRKANR